MTTPSVATERSSWLRVCLWCVVAVLAEVALYASYRGHDARFHWFTHFFAGSSLALTVMAAIATKLRRPVRLPLAWLLLAHVVAMFPDLLFIAGIAHDRWMDVFLGHIAAHFVPGRNVTWFVVFLGTLGAYLVVVACVVAGGERPEASSRTRLSGGNPT